MNTQADAFLLSHMEDLAAQAEKAGCACSHFLSPAESEAVRRRFVHRRDVDLRFDGGFAEAERTAAIFLQPDWGVYEPDAVLAALSLTFQGPPSSRTVGGDLKTPKISHRDILGAALGLGLERRALGDILVREIEEPARKPIAEHLDAYFSPTHRRFPLECTKHSGEKSTRLVEKSPPIRPTQGFRAHSEAFLVCLSGLSDFIQENLTKAGRVHMTARRIPLRALPNDAPAMEKRETTVASLRLDAVVSAAFRLSRGAACEHIRAGHVALSHIPCEDAARAVKEGDVISVRGLGRARLLETSGLSQKGRLWIKIGLS